MAVQQHSLQQVLGNSNTTDKAVLFANVANSSASAQANSDPGFIVSNSAGALTVQLGTGTSNAARIVISSNTGTANDAYVEFAAGAAVRGYVGTQGAAGDLVAGSQVGDLILAVVDGQTNNVYIKSAGTINVNGVIQAQSSPLTNTQTRVMTGAAVFMTANTQRTSVTALTNEANLTITLNEVGTYRVESLIILSSANSNCGMNIDFQGGSATITTLALQASGIVGDTLFIGSGASGANFVPVGSINQFSNNGLTSEQFDGIVVFSTTGTFIPRIAQFKSTAQTMNIVTGSYVYVTKIG